MDGISLDTALLFKYFRGLTTGEERKRVEDWMQISEENEKTVLQAARIFYISQTSERILSRNSIEAYKKVQKRIDKRKKKIRLYEISIVAACFVGLLVISTAISFLLRKSSVLAPQQITVCANRGVRTSLDLPDGSIAYLNSGSTLSYTMPSENILVLTYDNVSYLFKKYKKGTQSDSANTTGPLLNLTENDVWYSKEDFTTDTNRYKLSLYDNYMELHSLDEKAATENEPAFITNFFYLSSRDNEFTFYTYKDDSMNLPAVFKDLPNGFSKCTMKIHAENNSLTLSYKGQNLLFTNK